MDEAERWLSKNDPTLKNYTTRRKSEYPFHTAWQEFSRNQRELPVSNLTIMHNRIGLSEDDAWFIRNTID